MIKQSCEEPDKVCCDHDCVECEHNYEEVVCSCHGITFETEGKSKEVQEKYKVEVVGNISSSEVAIEMETVEAALCRAGAFA